MGDWSINIVGTGAHHNSKKRGGAFEHEESVKFDANEATTEFIANLKAQGHTIHHASFVSGSKDYWVTADAAPEAEEEMKPQVTD